MTSEMYQREKNTPPLIEGRESELTISLLRDLIRIPSFVDKDHNERRLVDYITDLFQRDGHFQVEQQPVEGERVNLIVHDGTPPKIVLFGHMDTVAPSQSTKNQFDGRIEDGKVFGRGAVDMKAGVAIAISTALRLKPQGLAIILTSDEEFDFKGALKLKDEVDLKPQYVVNLEPTDGEILNGCRGITEFTTLIEGKSAHASRKDLGVNAILKTDEFYHQLEARLREWDLPEVKNSLNFSAINAGSLKEFQPDGSPVIIRSANKVPDVAYPLFEIRVANPKMTEDDLRRLINEIATRSGINYKDLKIKFFLGSMKQSSKENLKPFEEAISANGLPVKYLDVNRSGFYEVQLLQEKWGGTYIIFGPGPHDLAHAPDEYVEISSIIKAQRVVDFFLRSTTK